MSMTSRIDQLERNYIFYPKYFGTDIRRLKTTMSMKYIQLLDKLNDPIAKWISRP